MIESEKEYKSAGQWAWFAERDARMRSAVNSTTFSDAQKLKAERVKLALEMVYSAEKVYIEYRKKFISVKVHKANVRDRKGLLLLEMCYENEGLQKVKTPQGVTYRIIKV
jgi:allophanate hydrolase subunit 1